MFNLHVPLHARHRAASLAALALGTLLAAMLGNPYLLAQGAGRAAVLLAAAALVPALLVAALAWVLRRLLHRAAPTVAGAAPRPDYGHVVLHARRTPLFGDRVL